MFTGIVEEQGRIVQRGAAEGQENLIIEADLVLGDLKIGHSIAVNGVCLTVVEREKSRFTVQVIPETMARSNLGDLADGTPVNLERALSALDRFHGHVVQGHVETVGVVNHVSTGSEDVRMTITLDHEWLRYCIPKGSISIDGVSLTLADVSAAGITVALIPHTLEITNLGRRELGDTVNIETDILARYLERFWEFEMEDDPPMIDISRPQRWGFGES